MNKDQIIARQSSLKFVIEYLNLVSSPLPINETVGLTEVITEYVLNGRTKDVVNKLNRFDHYLSDKVVTDITTKVKFEMDGLNQERGV